ITRGERMSEGKGGKTGYKLRIAILYIELAIHDHLFISPRNILHTRTALES
ncbi:hypothetical protein ACH5RR_031878, partial [Cinchona calisaya]